MFAILAVAALAAASVALPSTVVRHADLDLSTARGQAQLDRRLARAARFVCRAESTLTPQLVNDARRCARDTLATTHRDRDQAVANRSTMPIAVVAR